MVKILFIVSLCIGLSACALVSEKECITKNWFQQGALDAKSGKPKSMFGKYKQSCKNYGIEIDQDEYAAGFESEER